MPFLESVAREQPGGEDRVRLTVSAEAPATIETDPLRLHQILTNLLANALKYSSQDHPVSLAVGRDGDAVVLDVTDRGPGIALEELRGSSSPSTGRRAGVPTADGAGLGLAITRRLAEALGGHLTATSVVGEGRCSGSASRRALSTRSTV